MEEEDFITRVRIISTSAADKMEEEKITPDIISQMSDDELSRYIPRHGDRIRLRSKLRGETPKKKKNKLLNILQQKLEAARKNKSADEEDTDDMRFPHRPYGNKNATKIKRQIEIGWIHKTSQRSIQVRKNKGGGTRKLEVPKTATKEMLIKEAISLFFPEGVSAKGPISAFECDLWDFADRVIAPDVTIASMYETTKMPILRFYLSTTQKGADPDPIDTPNSPDLSKTNNVYNNDTSNSPGPSQTNNVDNNDDSTDDILHNAMEIAGLPFTITEVEPLPDLTENPPEAPPNSKHVSLTLHRGHLLKEMIQGFKSINPFKDTVSVQMVMPDGRLEAAEDGGGVTRDALSDFWASFYDQCTLGSKFKIPFLRHDFAEDEWQAVANIMVFGWEACSYFPITISLPFLQMCLFEKSSANILEAFFDILPEGETNTLRKALSQNVWDVQDQDDIIEILETHESKSVPTPMNIDRLLNEIAHKEIIQTPMFIVDCFQPILKKLDITEDRLDQLHAELIPTPRAVNKLLKFPDIMCAEEQGVSNHLRRFIRELNQQVLRKFVRFCTGSDLMLNKDIKVAFVNVSGIARRPVAHTCSCLLELSKSYENFPLFRSEFLAVLESNVWVMDII